MDQTADTAGLTLRCMNCRNRIIPSVFSSGACVLVLRRLQPPARRASRNGPHPSLALHARGQRSHHQRGGADPRGSRGLRQAAAATNARNRRRPASRRRAQRPRGSRPRRCAGRGRRRVRSIVGDLCRGHRDRRQGPRLPQRGPTSEACPIPRATSIAGYGTSAGSEAARSANVSGAGAEPHTESQPKPFSIA